jgi:Rrf2 family protein
MVTYHGRYARHCRRNRGEYYNLHEIQALLYFRPVFHLTWRVGPDKIQVRLFKSYFAGGRSSPMFKLSKKADYGLIAVKHLATHRNGHACSANEISEEYGISTTLMAKVLQKLARQGLVAATHGSSGGYQLAKEPGQISALDVISAIDGPVLITSCVTSHGNCDATDKCSVREPLRRVNESILHVLSAVTISQMSEDPQEPALVALSAASRPLVTTT